MVSTVEESFDATKLLQSLSLFKESNASFLHDWRTVVFDGKIPRSNLDTEKVTFNAGSSTVSETGSKSEHAGFVSGLAPVTVPWWQGSAVLATEIVESVHATLPHEDWSKCRSPSRARRRWKQGYPQHVVCSRRPAVYKIDDKFFVHPEIMRHLGEQIETRMQKEMSNVWSR